MKTTKVAAEAALAFQHQLQLVESDLADGLLVVEDLRHVAGMAQLVLVDRQVLVLADALHERAQLGLRADPLDVELVFGQINRDAECLLKGRIANNRTDSIVLTRCVQAARRNAEVGR